MRLNKDDWEKQYREGKWNYLSTSQEKDRYVQIGSYLNTFCHRGKVLDIGCGSGLLLGFLKEQLYKGIDISTTAITTAVATAETRTEATDQKRKNASFLCVSAENFTTTERFEAIVFNEILYYLQDPLKILEKYETFLAPKGIFVISLWKHPKTVLLWEEIKKKYVLKKNTEVCHTDSGNVWIMGVFEP